MTDYKDDDVLYDTHWLSMKKAMIGAAIVNGLDITITGPLEVTIGTGAYVTTGGVVVKAAATIIAVDPNPLMTKRWDMIYGRSDGSILLTKGDDANIPIPPNIASFETLIGMIYWPANTSVLALEMIRNFGFNTTLGYHGQEHGNGEPWEISIDGVPGVLADEQPSAWSILSKPTEFNPEQHELDGIKHSNTGALGQIMKSNGAGGIAWANRPIPINRIGVIYCNPIPEIPIPQGVTTTIPFTTEIIDTDEMWDISTPSELKINTAGIYKIYIAVEIRCNSVDQGVLTLTGLKTYAFTLSSSGSAKVYRVECTVQIKADTLPITTSVTISQGNSSNVYLHKAEAVIIKVGDTGA